MVLEKRIANITDLNFIYGCLLFGARKGHYSFNPEDPEIVDSMKEEVQSVIVRNTLLDLRYSLASIFLVNNKRIGLSIISNSISVSSGVEIYALSVAGKYQNKGYGGQIIDDILNCYLYDDIYARCSPVSQSMYKLLLQRNFILNSMNGGYKVLLKRGLDSGDIAQPLMMNY